MSTTSKWAVSLMPGVAAQVEARRADGNRSGEINNSLERYYAILQDEGGRLMKSLSPLELSLIMEVLDGITFHDSLSIRYTWARIQDAVEKDGLDKKWGVNGSVLVAKIKALDLAATIALIDAVQKWQDGTPHTFETDELPRQVFGGTGKTD